jgi:hypothetical protein
VHTTLNLDDALLMEAKACTGGGLPLRPPAPPCGESLAGGVPGRLRAEPAACLAAHGGDGLSAISDGWIAAAVLARRQVLVTFDRDFLPLLPPRQLLLLLEG